MSSPASSYSRRLCALCVLGPRKTRISSRAGEPTAMHRRVVQPVIAVEGKKEAFGDVASRIHAVMARRGKTAHIDARAFFHHLFHWRLVAGDDDRLGALLHALIAGSSGAPHIYAESPRQAEPAGHQESHQRQLGALAVDDDVMTNQKRKALRFFELHRERGNLPLRAQRLLDVQYLLRIGGFVLL